ncbi:MAG TPA: DUF4160 domain-containing protein [Longimicrobium sp.]|nr:DUF4160 domain-containing protein [Longimicrobium sp.]
MIWSLEHGTPHVHVFKAEGVARIHLGWEGTPVLQEASMGPRDTRRAMEIVREHADMIRSEWRRLHGG